MRVKIRMTAIPGKKMIPVYVDEAIYRTIKVYSALTDQSIQMVCKPLADEYEQSAIKLCITINEMQRKAEQEKQKYEEEQKIAAEHPLLVTGQEIEPITQ